MAKSKTINNQKAKMDLPYGEYIFTDGSQILFNRYYEPIIQERLIDVDSLDLKIGSAKKQWFYNDSNPPWTNSETLEKCKTILKAFEVL